MTSIAHLYADFGDLTADGEGCETIPVERVEDQKLQAFENGYQAGWTDAEANQATEQTSINVEILHTLRDLAFTHQEALGRLNRGLQPMFDQIVKKLLPDTCNAALRSHLVEQLGILAATQTEGQINLRVSEMNFSMVENLMETIELDIPAVVVADQTLTQHQIFISLDLVEREINLDAVCNELTAAMNAFNFHSLTEPADD